MAPDDSLYTAVPSMFALLMVPMLCVAAAGKYAMDCGARLRARGAGWAVAMLLVLAVYMGTCLLLTLVAAGGWLLGMPMQVAFGLLQTSDLMECWSMAKDLNGDMWMSAVVLYVLAHLYAIVAPCVVVAFLVAERRRRRSGAAAPRGHALRQLAISVASVAVGAVAAELLYCGLEAERLWQQRTQAESQAHEKPGVDWR